MKRLTEEHKAKIGISTSLAKMGVPLTEAHKEALSKAAMRRKRKDCKYCAKPIAVNNIARHELVCGRKQ